MDLKPGEPLLDHPIDVVFIGSCTNSRLSDLARGGVRFSRDAMSRRMSVRSSFRDRIRSRKWPKHEGLDKIFKEAGAEWRESGCSMCIAMNADKLEPGQYSISTSNRNFEGRQGPGGRTMLASPLTAAASAVTGSVTDLRRMLNS